MVDLKPQVHRIVRLLDRTIGCDLVNVRPIGNVCYDLQKRSHCDRSFLLVVGHRTIGEDRWQDPSKKIVGNRTTSGSHKRSIVRSIVAPDDRSYDQSWNSA